MEIILVIYLKAKPLALCTIQIITTIPVIKHIFSITSMLIFNPNVSTLQQKVNIFS